MRIREGRILSREKISLDSDETLDKILRTIVINFYMNAAYIPNELIGMAGDIAVAKKATVVVKDVLNTAIFVLLNVNLNLSNLFSSEFTKVAI